MRTSAIVLTASLVLLSACGPARDPGYICMHDCAHYCPDGISGDDCRHNIQMQQGDHATDNGDYYPEGRSYYYGTVPGGPVTYVAPSVDGETTTTTTVTKTYSTY